MKIKYLIVSTIKDMIRKGALWIFGCGMFSQLCHFISSIYVVRKLEKIDYGNYVDANNIYSYFVPFIGMGLISAILQFCSENRQEKEKNGIYNFSIVSGTTFNVCLTACILIFSFVRILIGDKEPGYYIGKMAFIPFAVYLNSYYQIVLRIKKRNKEFGIINLINSATIVLGNVLFTGFWGVTGLIVSNYASNIVGGAIGYIITKKIGFTPKAKGCYEDISKKRKTEISKYAILCALTNLSSTVLVLLDITVMKIILDDPEILADYRVGAVIPSACMFIPSSLITFFYPYIVENLSKSKKSFTKFWGKLLLIFVSVDGIVAIMLVLFSGVFISTIYGERYISSVPLMRLLSINFFASSSFRKLFGNTISAMKKVHVNLYLSIVAGVSNIVLDIVLINRYGSFGAAIATLFVTCLISALEGIYIVREISHLNKIENKTNCNSIGAEYEK